MTATGSLLLNIGWFPRNEPTTISWRLVAATADGPTRARAQEILSYQRPATWVAVPRGVARTPGR